MLVLDTDAISLIQVGTGARHAALAELLDDADDDVYVTVVSLDEQLRGAFKEIGTDKANIRIRGYRRLRGIVEDYAQRPMLDYDELAEAIFDRLKGLKGRPGTKDLRIASIVLSRDATLITGNVSDFEKIPMLKIRRLPA